MESRIHPTCTRMYPDVPDPDVPDMYPDPPTRIIFQVIFLDHRSDGTEDGIWDGWQSIKYRWPNTNDKSVALSELNKWLEKRQKAAYYRRLPFGVRERFLGCYCVRARNCLGARLLAQVIVYARDCLRT